MTPVATLFPFPDAAAAPENAAPQFPALGIYTDLYQITMAYGYWKSGKADQEAVFHMFFRKNPFKSGYTVAAGLQSVIDYVKSFHFPKSDLDYLAALTGQDGQPLFEQEFIDYLGSLEFSCDIDAIPEGTVVFPHQPLMRVRGSLLQVQLLETAILNMVNFETLIATKASRVVLAAKGDPVSEIGMRRAQGWGSLQATRSAYIGGCVSTSNVLAGRAWGIPVRGTMAHSWVMSFETELDAFYAYAKTMPNNCIFLVDTYDTLQGVRNACEVGKWLREQGNEMVGIRLDSGDLAYLSIEARKILDEEGFPNAKIFVSNDLTEYTISSLKEQGAKIDCWGVGTMLVTASDQPALGGVFKLGAIQVEGKWDYKVKLSEQAIKISNPGIQQVRRFMSETEFIGDAIYSTDNVPDSFTIVDPLDATRRKHFKAEEKYEDLLVPIVRDGKVVYNSPTLNEIRDRAAKQLAMFHPGVKRQMNPHQYPVGLELGLHDLKTALILQARGVSTSGFEARRF